MAFSIGLDGGATFQIASGQGFGPKEQGGGGADLYFLFPVIRWLSVGTGVRLYETLPSDTTGGFVYRGYGTGGLSAFLEAGGPIAVWARAVRLEAGGQVGASANWAAYQYTNLFFFYPEVMVGGFFGLRFARLPFLQVRLSVPVSVQFRRDLDYSFSAAVCLGANYAFGGDR